MTQFDPRQVPPYHQPPYGHPYYGGASMEPPRTSLLSIAAVISSLILCCPLTSLAGIVLGAAGIASVGMSGGRRKGAGLAVIAIAVSLLGLALQTWVSFASWPLIEKGIEMVRYMTTGPQPLIAALERGDLAAARAELYPDADAAAEDTELIAFQEEMARRYGTLTRWEPLPNTNRQYNAPGVYHDDFRGKAVFASGAYDVTYTFTVKIGSPPAIFEALGLSKVVIHDRELGDLILDPATNEPTTESATQPDEDASDTTAPGAETHTDDEG